MPVLAENQTRFVIPNTGSSGALVRHPLLRCCSTAPISWEVSDPFSIPVSPCKHPSMCRSVIRAWHQGGVKDRSIPHGVCVSMMVLRQSGTATPVVSDTRQCAIFSKRTMPSHDDETCVCQISDPLVVHQPYAMALSGSVIVVFSVAVSVRLRASLQKNVNSSCQERARQNRIASISMSIGEECMRL